MRLTRINYFLPLIFIFWEILHEQGVRLSKVLLSFAFDGITSFSVKPIRMILNIGIGLFLFSIVMMVWSIVDKIQGNTIPGWTSLMISIWMIGGIQLIGIGFIGEYIGKIYGESKKRPRYIIESFLE